MMVSFLRWFLFFLLFTAYQTRLRNSTEDYRRETIDFVTLNAQPRRRNTDRKPQDSKKITRVAGRATMITERRARTPGRSHVWHQETADDTTHAGLQRATAVSPRDDESREDEDVSLFLDSFSASKMARKYPTSASEAATGAESPPTMPLRGGGGTLNGQTREADAATIDNVQATLAISEPLGQVKMSGRQR